MATTLSSVAVAKRDWRCPVRVARPVPADQGTVEPILWSIPDQCDKYYECNDDGTSAIRDCPPQMEFDMKTKQCGEATGRCTAKAPPSVSARVDDHLCVGQEDGQKIATNNCNSFIMCDNGVGRLQACEDGLLFDQEEGYCNWAQDVECGELVGPPQGAAPDCAGHEGEYLPNPYDCSTFYVCEHNAALIYNCEAGLYFDPAISNCNWKDSVQCVTQQLPEQQPWTPVRRCSIRR